MEGVLFFFCVTEYKINNLSHVLTVVFFYQSVTEFPLRKMFVFKCPKPAKSKWERQRVRVSSNPGLATKLA